MQRHTRLFITIFVFSILIVCFIYFTLYRTIESTFLKGRIDYLELNHESSFKTITKYKELKDILNYIDSINYNEEPEMTALRGGDSYGVKIFRKNKKYDSEYLVFYHKYIHYICINKSPRKKIIDVWYSGNEDIFITVKNFYNNAKQ